MPNSVPDPAQPGLPQATELERTVDARVHSSPAQVRKVAAASAFGTGIELYDFLIFGLASGLVFPKLFFPQSEPLIGTLLAFLTFGAGFVSRPIGGLVFGHFGDRISRRLMLVISLVATGVCTVSMGLLPTYATVGVLAPVLLVALRLLQGFFMGGEQSGAFLMVTEHARAGSKAFYGSFATAGSPIGSILGLLAFQTTSTLTGPDFITYGWRIPFLASAILVIVGVYIRIGLDESPVFAQLKARQAHVAKVPLGGVFAKGGLMVLAGVLVNLGFNMFIFIINSFSVSYGTAVLKMERNDILMSGLAGSAGMLITVFIAARLADRYGLVKVMAAGALFQVLWAYPYFLLFNTRSVALVYVAVIVGYIGLSFIFGPMAAYYAHLFDPEHRYSGVAFSYNMGAVLGGGLSSSVAQALIAGGGGWAAISGYILLGGVLSLVGVLISRRRLATHFPRRVAGAGTERIAA